MLTSNTPSAVLLRGIQAKASKQTMWPLAVVLALSKKPFINADDVKGTSINPRFPTSCMG